MRNERTIGIVDDDDALRDSLGILLRLKGYGVVEFSNGDELLAARSAANLDCVILDLRLPGPDGLSVLDACRAVGMSMPIIVATAFGDVSSTRRALKAGAFDFLEKPIREAEMMRVISDALQHFDQASALLAERTELEERLARLSNRERQVLNAVIAGKHNREIASALALSVRTVEVYKARVMEKMRVTRLVELLRLLTRMEWAGTNNGTDRQQ